MLQNEYQLTKSASIQPRTSLSARLNKKIAARSALSAPPPRSFVRSRSGTGDPAGVVGRDGRRCAAASSKKTCVPRRSFPLAARSESATNAKFLRYFLEMHQTCNIILIEISEIVRFCKNLSRL